MRRIRGLAVLPCLALVPFFVSAPDRDSGDTAQRWAGAQPESAGVGAEEVDPGEEGIKKSHTNPSGVGFPAEELTTSFVLPEWLGQYLASTEERHKKDPESSRVIAEITDAEEASQFQDTVRFQEEVALLRERLESQEKVAQSILVGLVAARPTEETSGEELWVAIRDMIASSRDRSLIRLLAAEEDRLAGETRQEAIEASGGLARALRDAEGPELRALLAAIDRVAMQDPAVSEVLREIASGAFPKDLRELALFRHLDLPTVDTARFMVDFLEKNHDTDLRRVAFRVLSRVSDPFVTPTLIQTLQENPDPSFRRFAIGGLEHQATSDDVAQALIFASQEDRDFMVRFRAVSASIRHAKVPAVGENLMWVVQNEPNIDLRAKAAQVLAYSPLPQVKKVLQHVGETDGARVVREHAKHSLRVYEQRLGHSVR